MPDPWIYQFRVKAFKPETMPLKRLVQYLGPLADLFGVEGVHLIEITESSHASALLIDEPYKPEVEARLAGARVGNADKRAIKGFNQINALLSEDETSGTIEAPDGAEVIFFPGSTKDTKILRGIKQFGSFDGFVETIGGPNEWAPVRVRTFEGKTATGFRAHRDLIKTLASHIYDPVRLSGEGTYSKTADGNWYLDRFNIRSFELLEDESVLDALNRARAYGRNLPADIAGRIADARNEVA